MSTIRRFGVRVGLMFWLMWSGALAHGASAAPRPSQERPNIVVILTDDMGYSDIGCYGSEIATPNIDSLAAGGVRFTQFYNATRCCPTRASLLTGLYPHQAGMGFMVRRVAQPGYRGDLHRNTPTIAEVLKRAGYRTGMVGKWHVALSHAAANGTDNWPVQRGFDYFYGTLRGFGSFFDPETLCRQNTFITPENDPDYRPEHYYYTDAISDNAVSFLRSTSGSADPFFLYVAYTAAHWPLQAPEADIAKYRGRYDGGYDAVRRARLARMKQLGVVDDGWALPPTVGRWDEVKDKAFEARCMEVYAAMVDNMDRGVGRIVEQLKRDGRLENTLVLYLHDNGACAEPSHRQPDRTPAPANLRPLRPDELQTRNTPPMQTRDGKWVKAGSAAMPGPADTYASYGEAWANVSNTPFREYKHWAHEGGISTPMIAHWPAGIGAAQRGSFVRVPAHIIDLMATCLDVAGAEFPKEFAGKPTKPIEGVSLRPALAARDVVRRQPLFWEHESNRAVRAGQWKLVAMENQPWELYDMAVDRTETRNLAAEHPERVRELSAEWDAWAKRADVLPLGAWKPVYRTPGK